MVTNNPTDAVPLRASDVRTQLMTRSLWFGWWLLLATGGEVVTIGYGDGYHITSV